MMLLELFLKTLQFLIFISFCIRYSSCSCVDGCLKELTYALRADTNHTIKSAHITWTDEFDDSFAYAYTDENRTDLNFLFDIPTPELFVSKKFMEDSFVAFINMFRNQTEVENVEISAPMLSDEMKKAINRKSKSDSKPKVNRYQFNSYDKTLYTTFLQLSSGTPKQLKISFFTFNERKEKVLDGRILLDKKIRNIEELDLRTVESDVTDAQLHQLASNSIYLRSITLSNAGINIILKEWQDGIRDTKHLKVVSDDIQRAEIMDGVMKRTLQRGVWEIRNRFNVSATVTISKIPTNLFDAKPTFEFVVSGA